MTPWHAYFHSKYFYMLYQALIFRFYLVLHSQYSFILLQIAAIAEIATRMIFLAGRIRPVGHKLSTTGSDVRLDIDSVILFYFKPTYFMGKLLG